MASNKTTHLSREKYGRSISIEETKSASNSSPKSTIACQRRLRRSTSGSSRLNTVDSNDSGIVISERDFDFDFGKKKHGKNGRKTRGKLNRALAILEAAGGKGPWDIIDGELSYQSYEDPFDPNYDSDSFDNCELDEIYLPREVDKVDTVLPSIISEYFENYDINEVTQTLKKINLSENGHQLLYRIVTLAMERKSPQREMASKLIAELFTNCYTSVELESGFNLLLKDLPELSLDTPKASQILGTFIARSIADECLSRRFVEAFELEGENKFADESVDFARNLLASEKAENFQKIWGVCGEILTVQCLESEIHAILKEFFRMKSILKTVENLKELNVPNFHHKFVFDLLVLTIERNNNLGRKNRKKRMAKRREIVESVGKLLDTLITSGILMTEQLEIGFEQFFNQITMICLRFETQLVHEILNQIIAVGTRCGYITAEIIRNLPKRARKRFASEGDGGKIKENQDY